MKVFMILLMAAPAVFGQVPAQDARGCVDSKVLTRMPGCMITRCDKKDYNGVDMPRKSNERGNIVEGEYEFLNYACAKEKSPLELGRNTEGALKNAGFQIYYTYVYGPGARFYMTAQKGAQWVKFESTGPGYALSMIKQKQMEQQMVANADGWAQQINQTGRVSVYGINFDTAKAAIRPDSEPVLAEVAKLLTVNRDWAVVVAGHTDNVGAKEMNITLSKARAESVIAWLAAHGIEKGRMVAAGFGDTRPVAENTTEDGKQKNRRVDLVKLY